MKREASIAYKDLREYIDAVDRLGEVYAVTAMTNTRKPVIPRNMCERKLTKNGKRF